MGTHHRAQSDDELLIGDLLARLGGDGLGLDVSLGHLGAGLEVNACMSADIE